MFLPTQNERLGQWVRAMSVSAAAGVVALALTGFTATMPSVAGHRLA